jgi:hypothetical protein
MTNYKIIFKKLGKIFALYGVQIWVMLFVANVAVITFIRAKAQTQTCMTVAQVESSPDCLYILDGGVYDPDGGSKPHNGHRCGMDITSILPSNHKSRASKYLSPNLRSSICTGNPQTPTPIPTQAPTQPPTQAPTQAPTQPPTAAPTQAAGATPTKTPTSNPAATKTPTPVPTKTPTTPPNIASNKTPTLTATPTPQATEIADNSGFLRLMSFISGNQTLPTPTPIADSPIEFSSVATPAPVERRGEKDAFTYSLIYWSTIFSYASFVILLITAGYWLIQRIKEIMEKQAEVKNIPGSSG